MLSSDIDVIVLKSYLIFCFQINPVVAFCNDSSILCIDIVNLVPLSLWWWKIFVATFEWSDINTFVTEFVNYFISFGTLSSRMISLAHILFLFSDISETTTEDNPTTMQTKTDATKSGTHWINLIQINIFAMKSLLDDLLIIGDLISII